MGAPGRSNFKISFWVRYCAYLEEPGREWQYIDQQGWLPAVALPERGSERVKEPGSP